MDQHSLQHLSPNPSSGEVEVTYHLLTDSGVRLEILDQSGQVIMQLIDPETFQKNGRHSIKWTRKYPSGIYLARLIKDGITEIRRIVIAK